MNNQNHPDQSAVYGAAAFSTLERAFVDSVEQLSPADTASTWVLVPTNLLALHLKRTAAEISSGIVGMRFLTLKDAARELASRRLASKSLSPVPRGAQELVVRRIMQERPDDAYFGSLMEFSNTPAALVSAISSLKNALWTPDALEEAASRLRSESTDTAEKLSEVALIWRRLDEWQTEQGYYDAENLLLTATDPGLVTKDLLPDRIAVYGFYDFTPLQKSLLRMLADVSHVWRCFLLWGEVDGEPAPGYEYAAPTVDFLRELSCTEGVCCLGQKGTATDLERVREDVFAEIPAGSEGTNGGVRQTELRDGSVKIVSCPGEFPQAVELIRQVLGAFASDSTRDSTDIGVLLRNTEGTTETLREAFNRADLEPYLREGLPLKHATAGRILLSLLDLAGGEAGRADLIQFLSLARIDWPKELSPTALDRLSRNAGITGEPGAWVGSLREHAEALEREAEHAESTPDEESAHEEARVARKAAGFLEGFAGQLSSLCNTADWDDLAGELETLLEEYAPEKEEGTAEVVEQVKELKSLAATGCPASVPVADWLLGRGLQQTSFRTGNFQDGGITVSSLMGSRGVTHDMVLVPGLSEKQFPAGISHDPILNEPDKSALNKCAPDFNAGGLATQARRSQEERYLFRIALGSARRGVVLCYPRMEEHSGRPKIPSRFLVKTCEALLGRSLTGEALEEGLAGSLVKRVRPDETTDSAGGSGPAVNLREFDLRTFQGASSRGAGVAYAKQISEFFARAMRIKTIRWGTDEFGPFDGHIDDQALLEYLQNRSEKAFRRMSPSQFESYAQCPFRYFLRYVLGVEEIEEPAEEFTISPLERGRTIHSLLHRVFRECLKDRELGKLDESTRRQALDYAGEIIDDVGETFPNRMPAAWAAERAGILDMLSSLLEAESDLPPGAAPHMFEADFGRGEREPVSRTLDDGTYLEFTGRIDRVDLLGEDSIQIVDYKTGSSRRYRKNSFAGGQQLQLPIYLLAGRSLTQRDAGQACYLFVPESKKVQEFTLEELENRSEDFRRALSLIVQGIRGGKFFMMPDEDSSRFCSNHCEYSTACGVARSKLAEIKSGDPALESLRELREIE